MPRSVKLRTAVPSVDQFGESLGISKKQQKSLTSIVERSPLTGRFAESHKGNAKLAKASPSEKGSRAIKH